MGIKVHNHVSLITAVTALITLGAFAPSTRPAWAQEANRDLHEIALRKGGKAVLRFSPDRAVRYPNLEELARRSDLIIVGRTLHNRSRLSPDGRFLSEIFWVRVQEVVKGNLPNAVKIPVVVPGGIWRFSDGSMVMLSPKASIRPENGSSYVFFLGEQSQVYRGREVVGGFQGVFDLTGGRVTPADQSPEDPVFEKYSGMNAGTFLSKLEASAGSRKATRTQASSPSGPTANVAAGLSKSARREAR